MLVHADNSSREHTGTALVTGANRGLGLEVSRQLGILGYDVLLGCRNSARGKEAERTLRSEGLRAEALVVDVSSPASTAAAFAHLERHNKRLDILVNNAAVHYDTWQSASAPDWAIVEEAFDINALGAWRTSLAAFPFLCRSTRPRIVNVSSEAGSIASMDGNTPAYRVSKVALNAITRMLATDWRSSGILVNAVCPGWTATEMGGNGGRSVEEGARGIVWSAALPDDGPTGGFFRDGEAISW